MNSDVLDLIFKKNIDFNTNLVSIKQVDNNNKNTYAYGDFLNLLTFNGTLRYLYRLRNKKTKKRLERYNQFSPDWISGSFIMISKKLLISKGIVSISKRIALMPKVIALIPKGNALISKRNASRPERKLISKRNA